MWGGDRVRAHCRAPPTHTVVRRGTGSYRERISQGMRHSVLIAVLIDCNRRIKLLRTDCPHQRCDRDTGSLTTTCSIILASSHPLTLAATYNLLFEYLNSDSSVSSEYRLKYFSFHLNSVSGNQEGTCFNIGIA